MVRRSAPFLVFALCSLLAVASIVGARQIGIQMDTVASFTSTANFDAGTKSQPGSPDGNYQVETTTDNPGVASEGLELASGKGDSFSMSDSDATTFKWTATNVGAGCSSPPRVIANGVLYTNTTGNPCYNGVQSVFTLSGSMNVTIKLHRNTLTGANSVMRIAILDVTTGFDAYDGSPSTGVKGVYYEYVQGGNLRAEQSSTGFWTQCGTNSAVSDNPIWLRIVRTLGTNNWAFSYSIDGSTYVADEACTQTTNNANFHVDIETATLSSSNSNADWDDYHVSAGTVNSGGYRTSGNWKSAGQTATTDLFQSVTINDSSASVSNYITAVSLIDGTGIYRYVNNTDLTTGTSTIEIVPQIAISGAWKVQVNFTGSGAASVVLEQIDVAHTLYIPPPPPVKVILDQATMAVAALLVLMGMLIVFTAIFIVLYGIKDRFLDPSVYKRGKN